MGASLLLCALSLATAPALPGSAAAGQDARDSAGRGQAVVSARQLFALADLAIKRGDERTAEAAYRALATDRDVEIRTEARFRLALMLARLGRLSAAALELRQILDEKPDAARVKLELAGLLVRMGDEQAARRLLRESQAAGLPPEVARMVDRFSAALRSRKPMGGTLELALAPDSNINRATRSDTLGTVLGDFALNRNARQRSGLGLSVKGQAFARAAIGANVSLLARLSGAGDFYGRGDFNDVSLGVSVGPELRLGADRLDVSAGAILRWFGGSPYSRTATVGLNFQHQLDRRSQIRTSASLNFVNNRINRRQDGRTYRVSALYERAVSARSGFGLSISGDRLDARDPGYSTVGGQISLFGYREIGSATVVGTLSYGRLRSDERLVIYPRKRSDTYAAASLAATFRKLTLGSLAPFIRIGLERNRSTIEIFDYRRVRTEFGLTRAF